MEADRYKQNHMLFIFCMICLLICLTLFSISFYILPHLIWGWHYNVPEFVFSIMEWLTEFYSFTDAGARTMIFFMFFIPALITGFISYIASNIIENKVLGIQPAKTPIEPKKTGELKETFGLAAKIIMLIALVIVVMLVIQWLITVPVTPQE